MQHEDHIWSALRQHLLYIIKHSVRFWCIVLTVMIIEIHLNKSEINVQLQHKARIHGPQWGRDSARVPFISINCSSFIRTIPTDLTFQLDMLKICELTNEPSWSLHHKKVYSDRLWSFATEIQWFSRGPPGRWKGSIWARRMNFPSWLLSVWTCDRREWEARSTASPRYIQLTPKAILYLPWSPSVWSLPCPQISKTGLREGATMAKSTHIGNEFVFLLKVQKQIIIWSNRDWMIQSNNPSSSSSCNVPNNLKKKGQYGPSQVHKVHWELMSKLPWCQR